MGPGLVPEAELERGPRGVRPVSAVERGVRPDIRRQTPDLRQHAKQHEQRRSEPAPRGYTAPQYPEIRNPPNPKPKSPKEVPKENKPARTSLFAADGSGATIFDEMMKRESRYNAFDNPDKELDYLDEEIEKAYAEVRGGRTVDIGASRESLPGHRRDPSTGEDFYAMPDKSRKRHSGHQARARQYDSGIEIGRGSDELRPDERGPPSVPIKQEDLLDRYLTEQHRRPEPAVPYGDDFVDTLY